jgi:DNA-directed RNA polymerase subunit RPC12/RpoP
VYRCPNCRHEFAVGLDQLPVGDDAWCPRCGERRATATTRTHAQGQRLAVDRTAFTWRDPRRWEIVVFRRPERASEWCVKRVVGLPGETISLDGGDVVVDGQVVRKSLSDQRAVRQAFESADLENRAPMGIDAAYAREWVQIADMVVKATDSFSYNQGTTPPVNEVPDVMITFVARLTGRGQLQLMATGDVGNVEAVADFSRREVTLRFDGDGVGTWALPASVVEGSSVEWTYSLFDRQVLLAVGDDVVIAEPLPWDVGSNASNAKQSASLEIRARGLTGQIDCVAVWRDLYYAVRHSDGRQPGVRRNGAVAWRLGPGEYFVLGDNAAISEDSRNWLSGAGLDAKLFIGRPLGLR